MRPSASAILEKAFRSTVMETDGSVPKNTQGSDLEAWFGKSKAVNDQGKPQVFYHGSPKLFSDFKEANHSVWTGPEQGDVTKTGVVYFTTDRATARSYGKNVYPAYLRILSPLVIDAKGAAYGDFTPFHHIGDALRGGHDGIIITNLRDDAGMGGEASTVAVVFKAAQIKVIQPKKPAKVTESREVAFTKSLLLEAAFTAKDIDLDKTYGTFKASYEKQTGKAWDKEKFLERIQNWTLYGDHDGFVAARQQASGPIKLVGAAGNPIGVKKGFQELLAGSKPVWGAMDLRLATMAARMGMKMPPAWIMTKVLTAIKDKFAAASGLPAGAVTVNKDGSLTIDYPDVGKATKFVVGNKAYFEWLLKTQGAAIPAMLRTAISYFLTTGKPPPEPKDQDQDEAFAIGEPHAGPEKAV